MSTEDIYSLILFVSVDFSFYYFKHFQVSFLENGFGWFGTLTWVVWAMGMWRKKVMMTGWSRRCMCCWKWKTGGNARDDGWGWSEVMWKCWVLMCKDALDLETWRDGVEWGWWLWLIYFVCYGYGYHRFIWDGLNGGGGYHRLIWKMALKRFCVFQHWYKCKRCWKRIIKLNFISTFLSFLLILFFWLSCLSIHWNLIITLVLGSIFKSVL